MWITTNGLGQRVVWYSEEEYQEVKNLNEVNKALLKATAKRNYSLLRKYNKFKNYLSELKNFIEKK